MQIFYFDPIYTSKEMLIAMKKVLKVNYVFSLMRVEDLMMIYFIFIRQNLLLNGSHQL